MAAARDAAVPAAKPGLRAQLEEADRRFAELEAQMADPAVLGQPGRRSLVMREYGTLRRLVEPFRQLRDAEKRLADAQSEAAGATDPEWRAMAEEEAATAGAARDRIWTQLTERALTDDPEGARDAILEIRAGVGGDEAALWVEDLFRMYQRWVSGKGWKLEVLAAAPGAVGGYKELSFSVTGERVYDALRFESGGHRVQRVPATEAQGRVHTSACTVAVLPEAEELDIDIKESDLEVTAMRSGGPGGQSVNKTSSAIRIIHLPTGEMVHCQEEKSQLKNRQRAMRLLRTRLYEKEIARRHAERNAMRKTQVGSGDRSERVRTYNYAQNRVTDHRIEGGEGEDAIQRSFSLDRVLEGELEPVLEALKAWHRKRQLAELGT